MEPSLRFTPLMDCGISIRIIDRDSGRYYDAFLSITIKAKTTVKYTHPLSLTKIRVFRIESL
jgi:hypothetical protein